MVDFVVRVAGEAGEGPTTIGDFMARSAARSGYSIYTFQTFPSEIKGGHAWLQTRIGEQTVLSFGESPDVLLALNEEAYARWGALVKPDGLVIYDSARFQLNGSCPVRTIGVPGEDLARNEVGSKIAQNVVMFGAVAELFGLDRAICEQLIRDRWQHKGTKVVETNLKAFEVGQRYMQQQGIRMPHLQLPLREDGRDRLIVTGHQALSMGAIAAGLQFFGGYPITPATSIMEWLSSHLPAFGGTLVQMEDEMAALGSVLGASFAGQKAMTATSGPGLALMIELLGLGVMSEVPAVIVDVQRGGPSTGMPTKTEQGDLNLAIYGAHGGAPRVVMAVSSVEDSFYTTIRAFNIAERLQVPVILLSDQALTTRISTIPRPDLSRVKVERRTTYEPGSNGGFHRFALTESGVSAMAVPGTAGTTYTATGLEHNENGNPNAEPAMHAAMMAKRSRKMQMALADQDDLVRWWGDENGCIGVMGWGSSEGVIREAVAQANQEGIPVMALHPRLLHPLPDKPVRRLLSRCRRVLVPENNFSGQFVQYLRSQYYGQWHGTSEYMGRWDGEFVPLNKCDGMPFTAKEILDGIRGIAD